MPCMMYVCICLPVHDVVCTLSYVFSGYESLWSGTIYMTFCPAGCLLGGGVGCVTDVGCPLGLYVVGRWGGVGWGRRAALSPPCPPVQNLT